MSGIDTLREIVETIPIPIIAIGGIDKGNTPEIIKAGAHGIAVISAVCCKENPEGATKGLYEAIYSGTSGGSHA